MTDLGGGRRIALEVRGLRKAFGGQEVLHGVDLTVAGGEIRGFLGANGAGKSTLIGCLGGAIRPDVGEIVVDGISHAGFSPRGAADAGIAVIYQHSNSVAGLTVAQNVFLGDELRTRTGLVRTRRQERRAAELLAGLGSDLDPRTPVERLTVGEQQLVEIVKSLRRDPAVLILDEPTASLSDHEAQALAGTLRDLRASTGLGVIYVSHLLGEVFGLVDSISVLRDGRIALDAPIGEVSRAEVIRNIAPDFAEAAARPPRAAQATTSAMPVLDVQGLRVSFAGPVDLTVGRGETVALFGLLGSGRTELLEAIIGARTRAAGQVLHRGRSRRGGVYRAIRDGMALVPADRKTRGIFADLPALENLLLPHIGSVARLGIRRRRAERSWFETLGARMDLRPAMPQRLGRFFSGGNQQKLVIGRWIGEQAPSDLLLLDEPTQGVDIGARRDVYRLIHELADAGMSTLFATSDPEEVLLLADRVVVLHRGLVIDSGPVAQYSVESLLALVHSSAVPTEEPTSKQESE